LPTRIGYARVQRDHAMQIEGKTAIVTGSASGVGRATALALARRGCHVLVNYSRSAQEAQESCAQVQALGVRALAFKADVANDAECRAMVEAALQAFGRVDVLVNNAGTTSFIEHGNLDAVGDDDWERILAVNLKGPFQCVRAARHALEAHGRGCVVNVSSIAGVRAIGSSIPYCASKAALNNLTLSLARALAPKIRVNAVAPGFITGRWLQSGLGQAYETAKKHYESRAPLKRVCDPEDVAEAILSLITGSDLVTGHILPVEGGVLLG
jgi:3-oxoacyl-[acyl-carrier protein] reductase